MPEQTPVTVGEFTRTIERLERTINEGFARVERNMVTRAEFEGREAQQDDRITDNATDITAVKASLQWALRTAITALVLPLVFLVITLYVTGGGSR